MLKYIYIYIKVLEVIFTKYNYCILHVIEKSHRHYQHDFKTQQNCVTFNSFVSRNLIFQQRTVCTDIVARIIKKTFIHCETHTRWLKDVTISFCYNLKARLPDCNVFFYFLNCTKEIVNVKYFITLMNKDTAKM